jgi:hypothetical protein
MANSTFKNNVCPSAKTATNGTLVAANIRRVFRFGRIKEIDNVVRMGKSDHMENARTILDIDFEYFIL